MPALFDGSWSTVFDEILSSGFGTVRLDPGEAQRLTGLYREAAAFFALDPPTKLRHSVPNRSIGYRPHAYAHAGYPDKPDLNDSFLYWQSKHRAPSNPDEISSFLDALEAYRVVTARIVSNLVEVMRLRYDYKHTLPFEDASVMQINSFGVASDQELLQQPHEDAVFLTVISTSAEGLEAVHGDISEPLKFASDEVLVMPGSVMTLMTGGEIPPLYHQARNHGILDRMSIMYFVSPDTTSAIEPFVVNDSNRMTDIRDLVIKNPQTFGLSEDFVLS
jgi:isopenicillin N synthase-like dioxygenase